MPKKLNVNIPKLWLCKYFYLFFFFIYSSLFLFNLNCFWNLHCFSISHGVVFRIKSTAILLNKTNQSFCYQKFDTKRNPLVVVYSNYPSNNSYGATILSAYLAIMLQSLLAYCRRHLRMTRWLTSYCQQLQKQFQFEVGVWIERKLSCNLRKSFLIIRKVLVKL